MGTAASRATAADPLECALCAERRPTELAIIHCGVVQHPVCLRRWRTPIGALVCSVCKRELTLEPPLPASKPAPTPPPPVPPLRWATDDEVRAQQARLTAADAGAIAAQGRHIATQALLDPNWAMPHTNPVNIGSTNAIRRVLRAYDQYMLGACFGWRRWEAGTSWGSITVPNAHTHGRLLEVMLFQLGDDLDPELRITATWNGADTWCVQLSAPLRAPALAVLVGVRWCRRCDRAFAGCGCDRWLAAPHPSDLLLCNPAAILRDGAPSSATQELVA